MAVCSPRVTTAHQPDYSDLGRFVDFAPWRRLPPAARALAIWQYVTDRETGLFPVQGIYEDPDPGPEFAFHDERDVLKVLNVHGHGYCGLLSPTLAGIYARAGYAGARCTNLRENHHCVTEVLYDGEWHYFDVDLRGTLLRADGSVATLEEACTRPELWTDPPLPVAPFYPLDDKAAMYTSFSGCQLTRLFGWHKNGHTMDFVLRPGERLARGWDPQGRWFHPWPNAGGFDLEFLRRRFLEPPRGLKCKHRQWTRWTYGNGLFTYAPRLDDRHGDFAQGVTAQDGLRPTSRGVECAGAGMAVWDVRSPYIIVGEVVDLGPPPQVRDAATVAYRTLGPARLSVSTDDGHGWTCVHTVPAAGAATVDLTACVAGRYGYAVRFEFPPGSGLAQLSLDTWVQLAPPSLPRLVAGDNALTFATGDRHGHRTRVQEVRLNLREPRALERYLVQLDGDYQPLRHHARLRGDAVLRVAARTRPGIRWLTAGGYFHAPLDQRTANGNAIQWSIAGPAGPWQDVCTAGVPEWAGHWHYGMDGDVVFAAPVPEVFLRFRGAPGLNQLWIYAHEQVAAPESPLRVSHGYALDGRPQEHSRTCVGPEEYCIHCAGTPENRYIVFDAPSVPA